MITASPTLFVNVDQVQSKEYTKVSSTISPTFNIVDILSPDHDITHDSNFIEPTPIVNEACHAHRKLNK